MKILNEEMIERALEDIENVYYNSDNSFSAMKCFKQNIEKLYELKIEHFKLLEKFKRFEEMSNLIDSELLLVNTLANIKTDKCDKCIYKLKEGE